MSDYEKPVKQCQDAPVGFRTINQIIENQDAGRALLELEHTPTPESPPFATGNGNHGGGALALSSIDRVVGGEHNTPKIARGTIGLDVDPNLATFGAAVVNIRYRSGVCGSFFRVTTGAYFIPVVGLTNFYGEATALSDDDTTFRHCDTKPSSVVTLSNATTIVTAPGVFVYCWQEATLTGGVLGFEPADFSFDLTVYGNRDTDLSEWQPVVATAGGAAAARRQPWKPRSAVFFVP